MPRTISLPKTPNPMMLLANRLKSLGIPKAYLRHVALPEWWNDEIALNPTGYAQALGYVSRSLGLDINILLNPDAPLAFSPIPQAKFKLKKNTTDSEVNQNAHLALRVVKTAVAAFQHDSTKALPLTAAAIRQEILAKGQQWVSLENLLRWCWDNGIPVVSVSHLLPDAKKMDGLAANIDGCSAIALCTKKHQPAWLLFHLAHEIGHIILGHVGDSGILLDEEIETKSNSDKDEQDANEFAHELVANKMKFSSSILIRGEELAQAAKKLGKEHGVDPGFIALNYAWNHKQQPWGSANGALKCLAPQANALTLIQDEMRKHLNFDLLPEESVAWLLRMTDPD
jgi:Zn-dependent peptidase ImmA (M78 family)